ncbi:formate--tetrahydrofolate ligase [Lentilactobacillus farraginis]|uniref:Formate--tetrahydrofolate ligase n=2 Tax=Lentilactobacillus farraginis DSM 18382 = JCM 14108 TaxID=1423743 RepID=A0A0R1VNR7_9LACO|nr:formate--tetrahydrofolate ligase [Lentilactobacillus farraginis]KRM07472.1 formate--tetrahydrofolate ligase [Lentilactobacillus farraginis DSM 18382 = JCM 14108]
MKSDVEISQEAKMAPITTVTNQLGIDPDDLEQYGKFKTKVNFDPTASHQDGKLILVTSINPTAAGEGKTTVTIGLGDAFKELHKNVVLALREPSLGPVMGMKGGATGGGYAQVVPMEDINLHFTGDFDALTEAHNTLAALIDNHIQHGNQLNIDPRQIVWKRVLDVNDRELRQVVIGLGGRTSGVPRQDGFDITVASELMAILCLATSLQDLKKRISKILIGYTYDRQPVYVSDLHVEGALTLLLKDAVKPNLVQTLEQTPAFIHGGPFANIAHGCNSILATKAALAYGDYAITEAGFGSDLGAEKFMDIVTPRLNKTPDCVVVVATVRALKLNGGADKKELNVENLAALKKGVVNLKRHVEGMQQYGKPVIVAINKFATDSDDELSYLSNYVKNTLKVTGEIINSWAQGGQGGLDLAKKVIAACDTPADFHRLYDENAGVLEKMQAIVTRIYGGANVELSRKAKNQLKRIEKMGYDHLPVCMAKTQYSFTDNAKQLGAPENFTIHVSDLQLKLGAGFIVALTGKILTMPGLPSHPAALDMDIDENGRITGLF